MRFAGVLSLLIGFALLSGLSQCESPTCYDFDEEGNRFEFPCTTCAERDDNPCTADAWNIEPGLTCSLDQQPVLENGTECDLDGEPGICIDSVCEPKPTLAAGTWSTTWAATKLNGFGDDGCTFFPTSIGPVTFGASLTLEVVSDGSGSATLSYIVRFEDPLFIVLQDAGESALFSASTAIGHANVSEATTTLDPSFVGAPLGAAFFSDPTRFEYSTVLGSLTEVTLELSPTSFDPVVINWSGDFLFELTLDGMPLGVWSDEICIFETVGPDIEIPVIPAN